METALNEVLLDQKEAAALLGLQPRTLELWRWRGKGPNYFRVGAGRVRYDKAELREWLEAQKVKLQPA